MDILSDTDHPRWSKMQVVDPDTITRSREAHCWLPEEYWTFLATIGFGDVGFATFYEGPVTMEDLGLEGGPDGYVAFADDQAGCFFGFIPSQPAVIALDSSDWRSVFESQDLRVFVTELLQGD